MAVKNNLLHDFPATAMDYYTVVTPSVKASKRTYQRSAWPRRCGVDGWYGIVVVVP